MAMNDLDERKHRIFHQYEGTSKVLEFKPGRDDTWMLTVSTGSNKQGNYRQVTVPLFSGEYRVLMMTLRNMVGPMLSWC